MFEIVYFNYFKIKMIQSAWRCPNISSSHSWVTRSFTAIQSSIHVELHNIYFYKLGCWGGGTTNVTFHAEIAWQQKAKFILCVCMT